MQSVFMDDLRENLGELTSKESGAATSYKAIVSAGNPILSFTSVALGNIAFALMGYHLQSVVRNTPFIFSSAIKLVLASILVGVILWLLRSFASLLTWRFFSDYADEGDIGAFVSVEGMSDIVYVPFILVYIIASFLGSGGVALGAAIMAKIYIMYSSYPSVLAHASFLDRVLCILSSFGAMIVLRGIIYLLFAV